MLFIIVILFFVVKLLIWLYKNFLYKSKVVKKYTGKGKWAIITGCTAGIGEGFAYEMARRGTNLVLISRNEEKINSLIEKIEKKYKGIEMVAFVMDFSELDLSEKYEELCEFVEDKEVTILVNNVGINTKYPKKFLDHTPEETGRMLHVNLMSGINMTRSILPKMVSKKKGLIFNLSSFAGVVPNPYQTIYSGNKAHIHAFSRGLRMECKKDKVEVLALTPMFVKSNMSGFRRTNMQVISATKFARLSLDRVGCPFDGAVVCPYWFHSMMTWVMSILPQGYVDKSIMKKHIGTQKYLMKKNKGQ